MAFNYWLDSKLLTKFVPISAITPKYLLLLMLYTFYPLVSLSYFTKISIIFKNIPKDNNELSHLHFLATEDSESRIR